MVKITGKSKSAIEPAVRQTRGPGMNLGLKKFRFGKFSKKTGPSEPQSGAKTASGRTPALPKDPEPSYLGKFNLPTGRKRK